MNDQEKTREQLIAENEELRRRVAELEASGRSPGGGYGPWQSSDSRWQSLVANTSVFILMVDQDHRIRFANHTDSGAALHQIVGKSVSVFFRAEHREMVRECVQRVFQTGQPGLYEGPALRLDNQEHWYAAHLGPIFEDGKVVAVSVIAIDVTDRKRAEEESARNKAILQAAIECLPFEFFAIGPDGRYILQNAVLREHYGDAIGQRPEDYAPDESARQLWLDNNRRALAGERVEGEIEVHVGDETRHFYNVITPIRDAGKICGILGVNVDITGRKLAERQLRQANEQLEQRVLERTAELTKANDRLHAEVAQREQAEDARRQNEAQYRALVESSPDAVVMVDLQGRIVFASQRAAEQHGARHPHELIGTPAEFLVVEQERERFHYGSRLLIEQGVRRNDHYTGLRRDGTTFAAELSSAIIRDAAGQPEGLMGVYRDVSERKRAEEKLAILGRFVEAASQGFGMADLEGRIIYVNPFLARLFGAQRPEDVIGMPASKYYPAEHMARREREVIPALRRGETWHSELTMVLPDGAFCSVMQTTFPVWDDNGELLCTAKVLTDITEIKRAEDALRQSYEELRTIYECMVDGLLIADVETREFVKANRAICGMLGYSPEQLLGMSVQDIHPQEDLPAVLATFQSQAEGRFDLADSLPMLRRDGSVFYADVSANRMVYNGRPCLIGFFRDVTERKRAEKVMRHALAQLETIYGGMIEGLLITDIATKRFVRVNASLCRMLGYSEEELLAAAIKDIHPPEEVPNDLQRFQAAAEGRVSLNVDRPVLRKDGSIFYADITGHQIFYDGRPCLLALFRDVTERRLAEDKVKAGQRALRRMLLASDHERQLITYELHDGVAQQLMGAIMHFQSQEPRQDRKSKATDAYREGMTALRQASLEIRSVMSRLRTPVLDMYGLIEAIGDVVSQLRSAPGAPEIEYSPAVKFERLAPTLENTLFRIAQEAMSNACRHSKSGKVAVKLTQPGDDVTLEVQDWGIGFDQDAVQENRFGLEGIRERCRILGGELSIHSKPGEGTQIRVTFPVLEATDED